MGYRPDIEGLRAVSILLVVAVHAGVARLAGGFVGVDVFFVISGFLITGLLITEVGRSGRIQFAAFYTRRLRRLLPALLLMLVIVSLLARMLLPVEEQRIQAVTAAMASLWMSNLQFAWGHLDYFAPDKDTNLFLHTWSLGVEEQFYLLWPILIYWLLSTGGYRRAAWAFAGIAAVSLVACAVITDALPEVAFYMMPLRAWQFATGSLSWLFFARNVNSPRLALRPTSLIATECAGWIALGLVVTSALVFDTNTPYPGLAAIVPTLGAAGILIVGSVLPTAGVSRLLGLAPLQSIGRISYSWYLWHWPVLLLGRSIQASESTIATAIEVMLSLLLAVASYHFVEAPIRGQRYWLSHRRLAILGSLGLMAMASALGLRWYYLPIAPTLDPELGAKRERYVRASTENPVIYARGCNADLLSSAVGFCAFGEAGAAHTAVLVGDSTAAQWSTTAIDAFHQPGWRLLVSTKSGCPIVDGPYFYWVIHRQFTECAAWRQEVVKQIAALKPDMVVVSSYWWDNRSSPQKWWVDGTRSVLDVLSPSAGHVYLLRSTPRLPFKGPNCLMQRLVFGGLAGVEPSCRMRYPDPQEAQIFAWLRSATADFPNASTIDMNETVCPGGICSAERDGEVIFRDDHHLATRYASTLAPELARRLGVTGAGVADPSRQATR